MSDVSGELTHLDPLHPAYFTTEEVDHSIGTVNGNFMIFEDGGPIGRSLAVARAAGSVAVLDAGCGSGRALVQLKRHLVAVTGLSADAVTAVGIDRHDYTEFLDTDYRAQVRAGFVELRRADLTTVELEPTFDVAYASEVIVHNAGFRDIIANLLHGLKPGGVLYTSTTIEQAAAFEGTAAELHAEGWTVDSQEVTRQFWSGDGSRTFQRFTNLAA